MTAETASTTRTVDWRTTATSIRAALAAAWVWLQATRTSRPARILARPAVWVWRPLRLLGVGLWTAPTEYHRWRLATDYDEAIAIAKDAKDQTKAIIGQDRKDAAIAARSLATARASRIAVAIGFGGWIWATLGLAFAAAAAGILYARAEKDTKAAACPKARQFARFRHALIALTVSIVLELVDAVRGYVASPVHLGSDGLPGAVRFARALRGEAGFNSAWSPVLLWWPGIVLWIAAIILIMWARNGTIGDDLQDLAPAEPESTETGPGSIVEAVKASWSGPMPKDAKPAVVAPGVTWSADRTVWRATVDTGGPSAGPIVKSREDLASRLGLGASRLHLQIDEALGSRVDLTGIKGDPWGPASRSPLLDMPSVDLWKPIPFGRDVLRSEVALQLAFRNFLFGGIPDAGKSTACYPLWGSFVLSPSSRIWAIDGGEVDTRALFEAGLCHRWTTDRAGALEILEELDAEIDRRQGLLGEMRLKKVTPQFFSKMGVGFDLVIWDEMASFTNSADTQTSKKIMKLAMSIFQRCRKVGIIVALSTQSPSSQAIDTDGRDVISDRYALLCRTREMSDKILGGGHAAMGIDASMLDKRIKGLGWLSTAEGDRIVRAHYLSDTDLDEIIARGVALRGDVVRPADAIPARLIAVVELLRQHEVTSMRTAEIVGRLRAAGHLIPEGLPGQKLLARELKAVDGDIQQVKVRSDGGQYHYLLLDLEGALRKLVNAA